MSWAFSLPLTAHSSCWQAVADSHTPASGQNVVLGNCLCSTQRSSYTSLFSIFEHGCFGGNINIKPFDVLY